MRMTSKYKDNLKKRMTSNMKRNEFDLKCEDNLKMKTILKMKMTITSTTQANELWLTTKYVFSC